LTNEVIGPAGVFVVGGAGVASVAPIASWAVPATRAGGVVAAVTISVSAALSVPAVTVAAATAAATATAAAARVTTAMAGITSATVRVTTATTATVRVTAAALRAAAVAGVSGIGGDHRDGGASGHQECSNRPGTRGDAKFLSGQRPSPTRGETAHPLHPGTFTPPSTADR
jgi:hypothetical protein